MITFRSAIASDLDLLYSWANDPDTRKNSYSTESITYEEHVKWFKGKIISPDCFFYIFSDDNGQPVGQVRVERKDFQDCLEAIISISIDRNHRGRGLASEMILQSSTDFQKNKHNTRLIAYVFKTNQPSIRSFLKAGYILFDEQEIAGVPSYILHKNRLT